jgi:D-sedoheptulose 7-phosphate isomerase
MDSEFISQYLKQAQDLCGSLDAASIEALISLLEDTRSRSGRLFILGVGGSAGNASHAVNDFRKITGIETYAPTDNVSELTARTNDEGWESVFSAWLEVSKLKAEDALLIFSVGGGNKEKNVSPNLVSALQYAKKVGAKIGGIVGPAGGYTAEVADACVKIPVSDSGLITPLSESFQTIVWHLLVSHPKLKRVQTKWESLNAK